MEELLKTVAQGGAVAVIAWYALFVLTREVRSLRDAILELPEKIAEKLGRTVVR